VPYGLKASLYERLLPDLQWHVAIFTSLLGSAVDVFGKVDKKEARRVLSQLRLPADFEGIHELRSKLA